MTPSPGPGSTPGITPGITPESASVSDERVDVRTPAELVELVLARVASGTPIVDYGQAHADLGNPPPARHTKLHYATDEPVIDHYDRDMTVRVHAGATLGQVQHALEPHNQFVPIDAAPDLAISEIICANVYGPLRVSLGGIRDLLLGLHYIDGQGRDIHVGGRTVKNVAGLDVTKLMVGSLGELGLIHQATLRTYAIPPQVLTVDIAVENPASLDDCLTTWLLTDAAPAAMHLQYTPRLPQPWLLRLAYHGTAAACASQFDSLKRFIETCQGMHIHDSTSTTLAQDLAHQASLRQWQRQAASVVKMVVPPASTGRALMTLAQAHDSREGFMLEALPVHGCIFVGGSLTDSQAMALDKLVGQIIGSSRGLRSWVRRPAGCTESIAPFAPLPQAMALLARLKTTMDPHHLFNPGRLLTLNKNPRPIAPHA